MILINEPTICRLEGYEDKRQLLQQHLVYHDKRVDYEIQKHKHAYWFLNRYGEQVWREKLDELKSQRMKSLLFGDEISGFWTYSGLAHTLQEKFDDQIQNHVVYPETKLIPWAKTPSKKARPYQIAMLEKLLQAKHGGVEVGTGLGKSFVIMQLAKSLGLKTVVMAPSISIAEQLHKEFEHHFGKKYVGRFFSSKKDSKKLFVIGVAASLARVEEGSDHWDNLSSAQVFIADESHLCPASTLANICFGLMAQAPYRFFFSGTQMRNDGLDMLLEGITGPIVFRMTVREGVDQGYLAKPIFRMMHVKTKSHKNSKDANEMTRAHLYYNDNVNRLAADLANKSVSLLGHQVLILIEEIEQFSKLLPYLRHPVRLAHGGVTAENKGKIPDEYHQSDPNALVAEFNDGKFPILVGTSCISTGTDVQAVKTMIYLKGGKSEIEVKQSVGRCTRLAEGKTECNIFDFDVDDVAVTSRHAAARRAIYEEIYGPVIEVNCG